MDDIDYKMIELLAADGRMSLSDLSREVGGSISTIRRRIQRLTEDGVFDIVAVTDPLKVGFRTQVVVTVTVVPKQVREVAEALAEHPAIRFIALTTGGSTLLVEAYFQSEENLVRFLLDDIPRIDGILQTETIHILKVFKRSWDYPVRGPHHHNDKNESMPSESGDDRRGGRIEADDALDLGA